MNEQTMTNDDDLIELGCGGSFTMTTRPLTREEREQVWDEMVNTYGFAGEDSRAMVDLVIKAVERIQDIAERKRLRYHGLDRTIEDEPSYCEACNGMGWTWEEKQVGERKSDVQTIALHCDKCEGTGYET